MKCEHCTRKECSKKTKTDDQENASVDVPSPAQENGEKGEFHKLADAKIFLSDCLACDSCVSAEEGIQVSQQNAKDFFQVLNLNKKCDTSKHRVLAVSVCPQSLPYFAAKFSLSVTDASRRLCGFLKSLGVHYVFDTTIAADFSILESQKEFVRRFRQHNEEEPALPMLTSACPGWVRYAERVLGHPVTPHLCTAKSPQQIMGSLVKDYFARRQNLSPDKIFHVIVAPCYDKKLEALQEDVLTASRGSRGTDCVLTSGEGGALGKATGRQAGEHVELRPSEQSRKRMCARGHCWHLNVPSLLVGEIAQMMEQSDVSVREAALDTLFGDVKEEELRRHDGAGSDGYLAHIFRHAAKELFNEDVGEVTYRALRNKDFQEVTLEKSGEVLLRFAAAYGFRNIQNVVLKLKKGKFPYHFVEVLACAGGCLNGRGQAQTADGRTDKTLLQKMKGIYADIPVQLPEASTHVQELYQEWLDGTDSPRVQEALHTAYQGPGRPADSRDIKW
ncbi:PREDICTED: nuclear prelamin A recognition factor isoform X2 [Capra hircus]|uniref:nuclear prelamin A recognition factor isoform X2 n=1 Tax=Capra hircus TaxID=9925 RepID=UPI00084750F0|nr:PREDICTED: nuclear prelamin A recognition factor isoform X2 [Capra hircus]